MVHDDFLMSVLAKQPHQVAKDWVKHRVDGTTHFIPIKDKKESIEFQNKRVSALIESINNKISGF